MTEQIPHRSDRRRPRARHGAGRRRTIPASLLTAAVLLGGGALVLADGAQGSSRSARGEDFVLHRNPGGGFTLEHPAGWRPEVIRGGVLLRIGGRDAVTVQRTELAKAVDTANVAQLRAVTDAVLSSPEADLRVLQAAPTTLGGLPGIHYLYTFSAPGARGVHTHWFAFHGRTMYTLVFQALPDSGFAALAPAFDAVAASFRTLES